MLYLKDRGRCGLEGTKREGREQCVRLGWSTQVNAREIDADDTGDGGGGWRWMLLWGLEGRVSLG